VTAEELVYVVPRAAVMASSGWYGLRTYARELPAFMEVLAGQGRFLPRSAMERDPAWKQVIPYLVLKDGVRYFLMRRTRGGGDARLHDMFTIGVGGHLNPGDGGIDGGLAREWQEELVADFEPPFRLVGLLNDDTTEVGRVHLGVVFVADADGRAVEVRETEKLSGAFATIDEVGAVRDRMETWSQLVFDALEGAGSSHASMR
jgi:predicted NUDIX family phosphoesterase